MFSFQLSLGITLLNIIHSSDIFCGPASCQNKQQCIEGDDCRIHCNGTDSCRFGKFICPDDYKCTIRCNGNFSCHNATIHAEMSSELNIDGCIDTNSCSLMSVYCPSYHQTTKKCKITGNNNIRNGVNYYTLHGYSDLAFNYTGDYGINNINIYCFSEYTHSCVVANDSFLCNPNGDISCNNGALFTSITSTNIPYPQQHNEITLHSWLHLGSIFGLDIIYFILLALIILIICVGCLLIRSVRKTNFLKVELDKVSTFSQCERSEMPIPDDNDENEPLKIQIALSSKASTTPPSPQTRPHASSVPIRFGFKSREDTTNGVESTGSPRSPESPASPRRYYNRGTNSPRHSEPPRLHIESQKYIHSESTSTQPCTVSLPQYHSNTQQRYLMPPIPHGRTQYIPQAMPVMPVMPHTPYQGTFKSPQPPHVQLPPIPISPNHVQHCQLQHQYPIHHDHHQHTRYIAQSSTEMIIRHIQTGHVPEINNNDVDIMSETVDDSEFVETVDDGGDNDSRSTTESTTTDSDSESSTTGTTVEPGAPIKMKDLIQNIDVDIAKRIYTEVGVDHETRLSVVGSNVATHASELTLDHVSEMTLDHQPVSLSEPSNVSPQTSVVHGSPSDCTPTQLTEHSAVTLATMLVHDTPTDNITPETIDALTKGDFPEIEFENIEIPEIEFEKSSQL